MSRAQVLEIVFMWYAEKTGSGFIINRGRQTYDHLLSHYNFAADGMRVATWKLFNRGEYVINTSFPNGTLGGMVFFVDELYYISSCQLINKYHDLL